MGRKDSRAIRNIVRLCSIHGMDEENLYEKALKVLTLYREMGWNSAIFNGKTVDKDLLEKEGDIRDALGFLSELQDYEGDAFIEKRLKPLFDSGIIREMVGYAMSKVRDYPHEGELYYRCLSICFLDGMIHTSEDIMELLGLCRGTYYDKRWESIMLFGVTFWGFAIPYVSDHLEESLKEFKLLNELIGSDN